MSPTAPHVEVEVVVAETTADVVAAAHHARRRGRRLVVPPPGAHPAPGDDVVVVDVSRLDGVAVDAPRRVATVGGGATWAAVLAAARPHGLAPVPAHDLHGGVVEGIRGGGLGWLARAHGLSRDGLRAAEVVTPEGDVVRATDAERAELLWALRGGGPVAVGVVTTAVVDLVPLAEVYAGDLRYPAAMAPEVVARWAAWTETLPAAMTSALVLVGAARGAIVRACFAGPVDRGRALLDPWRRWAEPADDRFAPMAVADLAALDGAPVDPAAPVTTEWLRGLPDEVVSALCAAVLLGPETGGPHRVEVRHVGGALRGPAGPVLAAPSDLLLRVVGGRPAAAATRRLTRLRDALAAAGAVTGGTYLGFAGPDEVAARAATAFDPPSLARLAALTAAPARP